MRLCMVIVIEIDFFKFAKKGDLLERYIVIYILIEDWILRLESE